MPEMSIITNENRDLETIFKGDVFFSSNTRDGANFVSRLEKTGTWHHDNIQDYHNCGFVKVKRKVEDILNSCKN